MRGLFDLFMIWINYFLRLMEETVLFLKKNVQLRTCQQDVH